MTLASNIRAGTAYVELVTRDAKLLRGLKRAQRQLQAFSAGAAAIGSKLSAAGLAGAAGFALAGRVFVSFDDKMRAVRAVTGATEAQFAALTAEARRLGAETSFSASQVADAMAELGRAGFDTDQIIASTAGVLDLSKATGTELPRSAEIAGAALRAFNLRASEAGRVADVLTAGANKSAQTLEDLFEAFKPVAPIAAEAGESIEDVVASIGVLANNGIKGSLAGNALARAYKNLSTTAGQSQLAGLGVQATDAVGNLRPMADIINDIADATRSMPTAKKLSVFESLFGRGQAAALKLASSGEAFRSLRNDIVNSAGTAQRTAAEMEAGVGGSFRRMMSAAESLAISVGKAVEGPLNAGLRVAQSAAGWTDQLVQKNPGLVRGLAAVVGGLLAGGAALLAVSGTAALAGLAVGGLLTTVSAAGTVIGVAGTALAAVLSPIGLVTAAVVGLGTAAVYYSGIGGAAVRWLGEQFDGLLDRWTPVVDSIRTSLTNGSIDAAGNVMWAALSLAWQQGTMSLQAVWLGLKAKMLTAWSELWHGMQTVLEIGLYKIETAWVSVVKAIGDVWDRLFGSIKKAWDSVVTPAAKAILYVQGIFDDSIDVDAAFAELDKQQQAYSDRVNSETDASVAGRDAKAGEQLDRAADRHEQVIRKIIKDADSAAEAIANGTADSLVEAYERLRKAREDLDEAMRTASDAGSGNGAGSVSGSGSLPGALQSILDGLGSAFDRTGLSSRGTFSASAVADLGNKQLDTLVDVTREVASNTKKIARNSSRGGLAFT